MAQSYVQEGVNIVCTEMASGEPQKIGIYNRTSYVIHKSDKAPLLNTGDRKLSNEFDCKIAGKFWGGLQILTAVLAVGALAIATVATGGLALVALGVAAVCAVGSIASGVTGLYTISHSCDITLESKWILEHDGVNIEKKPALLQHSVLMCNKGGALSIILDDVLAVEVAQKISDNNNKEFLWNMGSQAVQGIITVATTFSPIGILVGAPLSVYNYWNGESEKIDNRKQNLENYYLSQAQNEKKLLTETGNAAGQEVINGAIGTPGALIEEAISTTTANRAITQDIQRMGTQALERELAGDAAGAANARLAQQMASHSYFSFGWGNFFKGLGIGFAGGMINFGIDYLTDSKEDDLYRKSLLNLDEARKLDLSNNIGIISKTK